MASSGRTGQVKEAKTEVKDKLNEQCMKFLDECAFDKMTFAEIESVTFRTIKELWETKRKIAMTREQKDCLKPLSAQYLSKLLNTKKHNEEPATQDNYKIKKVCVRVKNIHMKGIEIDGLSNGINMSSSRKSSDSSRTVNQSTTTVSLPPRRVSKRPRKCELDEETDEDYTPSDE